MSTTNSFFNTAGGSVTGATGTASMFTPPPIVKCQQDYYTPYSASSGRSIPMPSNISAIDTVIFDVGVASGTFRGYKNGTSIWTTSPMSNYISANSNTIYPCIWYDFTNKKAFVILSCQNTNYYYSLLSINLETGVITTIGSATQSIPNSAPYINHGNILKETSPGTNICWVGNGTAYYTINFNTGAVTTDANNVLKNCGNLYVAGKYDVSLSTFGNTTTAYSSTTLNITNITTAAKAVNTVYTPDSISGIYSTSNNATYAMPLMTYGTTGYYVGSFILRNQLISTSAFDTYVDNIATYYGIN
jgi:hypothetical protein